jgi:hypothetical protein
MTEKRFDSLVTGLVPALVLPTFTMLCIWMIRSDSPLGEFLVDFQKLHMLSKLISISVIPFYMDRAEPVSQGRYFRHTVAGLFNADTQNSLSEI